MNAYFPDVEFDHNVLAGANPSAYPPANFFPSAAALMAEFVAPEARDFRLKSGSKYLTAAADGGPIGAAMRELAQILEGSDTKQDDRSNNRSHPRGRGSGG